MIYFWSIRIQTGIMWVVLICCNHSGSCFPALIRLTFPTLTLSPSPTPLLNLRTPLKTNSSSFFRCISWLQFQNLYFPKGYSNFMRNNLERRLSKKHCKPWILKFHIEERLTVIFIIMKIAQLKYLSRKYRNMFIIIQFSFSWTGWHTMVKEPSLLYYLLIAGGRTVIPRVLPLWDI